MLLCSASNRSKLSFKSCANTLASPCPIPQNSLRICTTPQKNQQNNSCVAFLRGSARFFFQSLYNINKFWFRFFFSVVGSRRLFSFYASAKQVYLDSMMNEWKTNGCNPSTTEKGNLGFSSFGNRRYKYLFFKTEPYSMAQRLSLGAQFLKRGSSWFFVLTIMTQSRFCFFVTNTTLTDSHE